MKNSAYWKKRYEQLEKASFQKGVQFYQRLDDQYVMASNQIDKEIRAWYQRFATNNKVSITEAKKLLNNQELKELKWTVNEYIKYGEENSIDGMFMKQLENASARYHISKLEALKLNTQCIIEQLYGNQTDQMTSFIKDVYTDNMFHSMYELQKGFNIGWNFSGIDEKKLEKLISKPWAVDGINFSDRIWQNKQKLINELNNELTSMCLTGKSPDIAIENIAKKMDVSKSRAKALVYTESSYFQSQSDRDTLKDFGCEKYEVLATLDSITSEICREMDGKVFDLNDYEVGVSAPPFHPHCRTVIVPAFDDDFDIGERAARDADGKTYYVPDDITYPEWKRAFVDGEHEGYTEFTKEGKKHFEKKNSSGIINLDDISWKDFEFNSRFSSKQESINYFTEELGIGFKDSKKYPINENMIVQMSNWHDKFKTMYAKFEETNPVKIPTINVLPPSKMKNAMGWYSYYQNNNKVVEIAMNGKNFTNFDILKKDLIRMVDSQWQSGSNIAHTFIHEYGHHISNSLRWITENPSFEYQFIKECIEEFQKTCPEVHGYWNMDKYVSRYGASNCSELFAETFAEYFGEENPREFANIFGKKLEKLLKEVNKK